MPTLLRTIVASILGIIVGGGIAESYLISAPVWFIALDLVAAYVPMAWLGWSMADRLKPVAAQ